MHGRNREISGKSAEQKDQRPIRVFDIGLRSADSPFLLKMDESLPCSEVVTSIDDCLQVKSLVKKIEQLPGDQYLVTYAAMPPLKEREFHSVYVDSEYIDSRHSETILLSHFLLRLTTQQLKDFPYEEIDVALILRAEKNKIIYHPGSWSGGIGGEYFDVPDPTNIITGVTLVFCYAYHTT